MATLQSAIRQFGWLTAAGGGPNCRIPHSSSRNREADYRAAIMAFAHLPNGFQKYDIDHPAFAMILLQ
jgi:hypothetical protein